MIRVALVVSRAATESGNLLAARLRALLDSGWDARLLCTGDRLAECTALRDPELADRVEITPLRDSYPLPRSLLRHPSRLLRYLGATGKTGPFDARLVQLRPDLIHFHSGPVARSAIWLHTVLKCRIAVSFREDGGDLEIPNPGPMWDGAHLFLFADAALLERAAGLGCPKGKAEVLGPPPPDVQPAIAGNGSAPGSLRIVSAGPLTWEQGFEHSVHAVRLLLDMGIGCEYRILGAGPHIEAVGFARHQLGLADHVQLALLDGGASLVDEIRAADVFVDPAVTDTTSLTPLLTAQALGVPFLSTPRAGLAADAGITVPRRNAQAIAEGLKTLAADAALREGMGEAGRAGANRHPTLDEHLQILQDVYHRALE